jgi:hypothetical protein
MNVPFPPVLLWPVPIGLVVGGIYWARARRRRWHDRVREWREITHGTNAEDKPPKLSPQPLWWLMILLGLVWGYWLARYSLPPLHGIVIDARNGARVSGATVIRYCFRTGPFSIADTHGPVGVPGSYVRVTTDDKGRFALPGAVVRSLTGMGWIAFKPGLMPGTGCYTASSMQPLGCAGFGASWHPDPWVRTTLQANVLRVRMEVDLFPPTTHGAPREGYDSSGRFLAATPPDFHSDGTPFVVDAWGEYFRRLNVLTYDRFLERDIFVSEGVAYVARGLALSDGIASQLLERVGAPIIERPIPLDHDPQVIRLRKAILDYCSQTPTSDFCRRSAVGVGYIRDFFQREAPSAR